MLTLILVAYIRSWRVQERLGFVNEFGRALKKFEGIFTPSLRQSCGRKTLSELPAGNQVFGRPFGEVVMSFQYSSRKFSNFRIFQKTQQRLFGNPSVAFGGYISVGLRS